MEEQNNNSPGYENGQPEDLDQDALPPVTRKPDTAILSPKSSLRRTLSPIQVSGDTSSLGENHEIILVIRGMVERLVVKENKPIILGRSDMRTRFVPDIDLTPYGALDRGVSREHSRIHLEGDRLYISDLDSTNGTFLAGKRLDPNTPTLIRKGDELVLGRLAVQILFR
ncbi:MAG TPA: FHA domain-containing protein [Phototrophicaceae bacterium]|jgi:hypothetical protein|nr:FHA domain-containing protein [Phototrophicaceae bacterium]